MHKIRMELVQIGKPTQINGSIKCVLIFNKTYQNIYIFIAIALD